MSVVMMAGGRILMVSGGAAVSSGGGTPSGFPDFTNTGPENHPSYPGSLSNNGTTNLSPGTYNFQRFTADVFLSSAGTYTFNGCEFTGGSRSWPPCLRINGASVNYSLDYCRIRPDLSVTQPTLWPCSPTAYACAIEDSYQYGLRSENQGTGLVDHTDVWGFGNAIDLPGGGDTTIGNSWIHDASEHNSGEYHTDGPGYLDGGGAPSNVVVRHCTIASRGNTNAIAFQAATSGYNGMVVDNCWMTWADDGGYVVDMCHGHSAFATNCKFINNVISSFVVPQNGFLYGGESSVFAVGETTNQWENNTVHLPNNNPADGMTTADDGKFLHPDGGVSATDYVDGFPG